MLEEKNHFREYNIIVILVDLPNVTNAVWPVAWNYKRNDFCDWC